MWRVKSAVSNSGCVARFVRPLLAKQHEPEVDPCAGKIGSKSYRLAIAFLGLHVPALVLQGIAEVAVRFGQLRLQPQRRPIGRDRLVKPVLGHERVAEVVIRSGRRLQAQRLPEAALGVGIVPGHAANRAEQLPGLGVAPIGMADLLKQGAGLG
ncbi:MAG: hypothetical protein A2150_02600 [Candidatus Muproteobacteria bacterium RBG_16_64_11]|uniref:Uncharacterized protein n=1 Tax=Candidatus Muproteobacteria bacterium RBG_16_64_11 TaxID=1817758 RepID=A0A1F6TFA2_9PROT|nr:MAG: hypothetical protein A2150_02600 [Candidatus Muproteobacteria bacterium RBG_16_64_11]